MNVRVLAFASAAEALGDRRLDLEIADGADVRALLELLARRYPPLVPILPRLAIAVDGEMAAPEAAIPDGAEVALLPPVSGGQAGRARLVRSSIDLERVEAELANPKSGAHLVFAGRVRDHDGDRPVEGLTYDAYESMALAALERIAADLEEAHAGLEVRIVHRLGDVPAGAASVVIAVASPHRAAAYEASRQALERLKREVPIWKCERYGDGGRRWREEEPLSAPDRASA